MHTHNLRSPLAVGLVAAVAAGAIALPPTAGHLGLPGLRVVSGANIGLASCFGGADGDYGKGFAEWCVNNPDGSYDPATLTITGLARGNTLTVTVNDSTNSITFTGPRGTTYGPYSLTAFYGAETFFRDLLQFSPGQRLENLQAIEAKLTVAKENLESAIEARVAAAKETLEKIAAEGLAIVVAAFFVVEQVLAALGYFNVAEASTAVASDSAAPADSLDGTSPAAQETWLAAASAAEVPAAEVEADVASAVPGDVSAAKAPAVEAKPEAAAVAEAAPEATRAAEDAEAPAVEAQTAEAPAVETVEATVATEIATLAMDVAEVKKDSDVAQPAPSSPSRRAPRAANRSNSATVEPTTRPHATASPAAVADAAPVKPAASRRASQTTEPSS
jgi:hypothetical protein